MVLCREIDDVMQLPLPIALETVGEDTANLELMRLAGLSVGNVVIGIALLEGKRKPLPHHADAVDGVDDGFCLGVEDIALYSVNHSITPFA